MGEADSQEETDRDRRRQTDRTPSLVAHYNRPTSGSIAYLLKDSSFSVILADRKNRPEKKKKKKIKSKTMLKVDLSLCMSNK